MYGTYNINFQHITCKHPIKYCKEILYRNIYLTGIFMYMHLIFVLFLGWITVWTTRITSTSFSSWDGSHVLLVLFSVFLQILPTVLERQSPFEAYSIIYATLCTHIFCVFSGHRTADEQLTHSFRVFCCIMFSVSLSFLFFYHIYLVCVNRSTLGEKSIIM